MGASRFIHICRQRLRSLFQKESLDAELDQEFLFHLELLEKENLEAGMSAADARRAARRTLGNVGLLKEECRDQRRVGWFYDFLQDFDYGIRMIRRRPGFTAIAAISLSLGIGANAAILNVGARLLLDELPLPAAEDLVIVRVLATQLGQVSAVSVPDFVAWSKSNHTFESIGASITSQQDLDGDETHSDPERLSGQAITPSLFPTLKIQPQMGRLFQEDEVQVGLPAPVVILSDRLWHRRFDGDRDILGKQIQLNGRSLKVVGVMPRGFFYPNEDTEFWVPLAFTKFQLQNSASLFTVTGRLKDGISGPQAQADLETIRSQLVQNLQDRNRGRSVFLVPLRDLWFGWIRRPLMTLEGAVILVLLIACANVSTLLLAHLPARQPEVAVRLLMGASRGRILRQFLTEGLILSLIGGTLGLGVAWWGMRSLAWLQPSPGGVSIPAMAWDGGVIGLVALLSVISCGLFGFIPAAVAFSSGTDLKQMTVHRRRGRFSGILVSAQVGLALILLISSGLLLNSFVRLLADDRGFSPDGILTFQYRIPVADYTRRFGSFHGMPDAEIEPPTLQIQRVYEKLKTLPGTDSVAGSSAPPVNVIVPPTATMWIEGQPIPTSADERAAANVYYFLVTDNYFETMHTPMLRGRDFAPQDTRSSPWVAVINEAMARRFWPGEDPIGKHFTVDAALGEQPREVIGIVRDVGLQYIRTGPPQAVAYSLYLQQPVRYEGFNAGSFGQMTFFVRSGQNPILLESAARRAVAEVDPSRPLSNFQTMQEYVGAGMRTRRYNASALGGFALLATILAAVGVYGVMSSSVSQRTREIGIHIAMGASSRDIVRLVGARAMRLIAIGLACGFFASLLLTRLLETQLWGITATDPITYAAVIFLLIGVSLAACFFPARRAMRVDPAEALRMD